MYAFSRLSKVLAIGLILVALAGCGASDTCNRAYTRGTNIKSMIAITNVAIALETHYLEHDEYPTADSMRQLRLALAPYLGEELGFDRWGEPLVVTVTADSYLLTSKGDDKEGGHEDGGPVETAGHSITLKNGIFVQYHASVESTARKYEAQIANARMRVETDA